MTQGRQSFGIDRDTYTYCSLRLYWKAEAEISLSLHDVTVLERERGENTVKNETKLVLEISKILKLV